MSNKRFTDNDWSDLQKLFNQWCLEEGKVSVNGYYEAKLRDKPFPSLSGFEKRAREHGWKAIAQKLLDRISGPIKKAQKKADEIEAKADKRNKELTLSGLMDEEANDTPRPEEASKIINECINDGLQGYSNGSKVFLLMSQITKVQLERMAETQSNGVGLLTIEEANATKSLVDATEKALKIFKQVAVVDSEQVKALTSLDEQYKLEAIKYKSDIDKRAKETDASKNQDHLYEELISYANDQGVDIN